GEKRREIQFRYRDSKTVRNEEVKVGRNEPCPCGSGKKYKKCCGK
ncbi:TPA: SEC-C metal-binding domain-containing protein, partial [Clostridium perfringens]